MEIFKISVFLGYAFQPFQPKLNIKNGVKMPNLHPFLRYNYIILPFKAYYGAKRQDMGSFNALKLNQMTFKC